MSDSNNSSANIAYISVIAIWATTPLAIKWSSDSLSPIAAVSSRMLLAFVCGTFLTLLFTRRVPLQSKNYKLYFVASLGLFPNMPLVYWGAQFIPSGLVSVIFALSPFLIGAASILLLGENPFNLRRVLSLFTAIFGLSLIFLDQLKFGEHAIWGISAMLISTTLFATSSVLVKKLSADVDAIEQTLGALAFSLPGLLLCWFFIDGAVPDKLSMTSVLSITYLAIFGSLLGFVAFFYVIQKLPVAAVSVIPLMPPVLALLLGYLLNDEILNQSIILGTSFIIGSLAIYEGGIVNFIFRQRKSTIS